MRCWTSLLLPIVVNAGAISTPTNCTAENAVSPECSSNEALHRRDFFYIGGRYVYDATSQGNLLVDQMYVEKLIPAAGIRQPHPLVFLHGGGISGVTWLQTPDNREGWASWFLDQGYAVYIVDQTSVGRSTQEDLAGYPLRIGATAEIAEIGFSAPERTNPYPQAQLHTQWPGSGVRGDPIFDAFFATFIPLTLNTTRQELSMRAAGCDLLSRIGPSYLISHSYGAQFATIISDQCPDLIVGNINVEPANFPFVNFVGNATVPSRPYGLTVTPITYDPPVASASDLQTVTVGEDSPALRSCKQQADPARRLPNIAKVPYLALTGEASIHITADQCVINYLKQCGAKPDWIKLADIGIHGNGHFMFLEKNNLQIAAVVNTWITQHNGRGEGYGRSVR